LILPLTLFLIFPDGESLSDPKTRTAQTRRPAPLIFTLYIQNTKPQGANGTFAATLYFHPNQRLKQKT
jgi:hypothetical protein